MSNKDLIKVTKELTGLELMITNEDYRSRGKMTGVRTHNPSNTIIHIKINLLEIKELNTKELNDRLGIDNRYLKILLHEIAHIKQLRKARSFDKFVFDYHCNSYYYENVADRYARLYYKKVLTALDKG